MAHTTNTNSKLLPFCNGKVDIGSEVGTFVTKNCSGKQRLVCSPQCGDQLGGKYYWPWHWLDFCHLVYISFFPSTVSEPSRWMELMSLKVWKGLKGN